MQRQAYDRYIAEAEKVSLDSGIKEVIKSGAIDISVYDEDTKKLIDEYQEWYEKALDCSDAIDELNLSLTDLYEQQFDNIVTKWTNALQDLEHAVERGESLISRRSDYASEYVSPDEADKASHMNITEYQGLFKNTQSQIEKKAAELRASQKAERERCQC